MTPKDWDRNEAAIKAAKAEILAALGVVAGVTAQTKTFTETVCGKIQKGGQPVIIYGKGRIWLNNNAGVIIDGQYDVNLFGEKTIYFESSAEVYMMDTSVGGAFASYVVQT